jgi:hypothetical protein
MSLDHSSDYTHAGPGAKRRARERLTIETVNKRIAKPKPEYRRNQKPQEEAIKLTLGHE